MKAKYCPVCLGTKRTTCHFCKALHYNSPGIDDKIKSRSTFMWELWQKAKKFHMESLGSADVDKEVMSYYGDWASDIPKKFYSSREIIDLINYNGKFQYHYRHWCDHNDRVLKAMVSRGELTTEDNYNFYFTEVFIGSC
jgi:hypothetical protein